MSDGRGTMKLEGDGLSVQKFILRWLEENKNHIIIVSSNIQFAGNNNAVIQTIEYVPRLNL